jgi:hypothetical protein
LLDNVSDGLPTGRLKALPFLKDDYVHIHPRATAQSLSVAELFPYPRDCRQQLSGAVSI